MKYVTKVLLGLDQFANTLIGGAPDETISARAGRLKNRPFWKQLAWTLDKIQPNHVENAICHEEDGSQQDAAYSEVYDLEDRCAIQGQTKRETQSNSAQESSSSRPTTEGTAEQPKK